MYSALFVAIEPCWDIPQFGVHISHLRKKKRMEAEAKIVLVDMEGNKHTADKRILSMSEYLKGMRDNGSIKDDTITLDSMKGSCVDKIIEFCEEQGGE